MISYHRTKANPTQTAFTLVELLAVIVILAIVLLITVPGVLSIINKTKEDAYQSQLKIIKEATRLYLTAEKQSVIWKQLGSSNYAYISEQELKEGGYLDKKLLDPRTKKEIPTFSVSVEKPASGKIRYEVVFTDSSQANYPVYYKDMIPIVYDGTKWVKADPTNANQSWFDYSNQQWANVATVNEATRDTYKNANIGTEVKMDDINAMYVWIPRYRYQLWNANNDPTYEPTGYQINVQFEEVTRHKSDGTQNGEYLTHPAFTFGEEELYGFWIGKFETSSQEGNGNSLEADNVTTKTPIVTPNRPSWGNTTLYTFFQNTKKMTTPGNPYGLATNQDAHPIKNMEWGAMAYLTYSSYGKAGNPNYTGADKEVRVNNNSSNQTGCAATTNNVWESDSCNTYDTTIGQTASTTGNISGVYDTSGGRWEWTMSLIYADATRTKVVTENTSFTDEALATIDPKYFDYYDHESNVTGSDREYDRGHLGDATKELGKFVYVESSLAAYSAWYHDYAHIMTSMRSIQMRGGDANHSYWSGPMAFVLTGAESFEVIGYRIILT